MYRRYFVFVCSISKSHGLRNLSIAVCLRPAPRLINNEDTDPPVYNIARSHIFQENDQIGGSLHRYGSACTFGLQSLCVRFSFIVASVIYKAPPEQPQTRTEPDID